MQPRLSLSLKASWLILQNAQIRVMHHLIKEVFMRKDTNHSTCLQGLLLERIKGHRLRLVQELKSDCYRKANEMGSNSSFKGGLREVSEDLNRTCLLITFSWFLLLQKDQDEEVRTGWLELEELRQCAWEIRYHPPDILKICKRISAPGASCLSSLQTSLLAQTAQ